MLVRSLILLFIKQSRFLGDEMFLRKRISIRPRIKESALRKLIKIPTQDFETCFLLFIVWISETLIERPVTASISSCSDLHKASCCPVPLSLVLSISPASLQEAPRVQSLCWVESTLWLGCNRTQCSWDPVACVSSWAFDKCESSTEAEQGVFPLWQRHSSNWSSQGLPTMLKQVMDFLVQDRLAK